MTDRELAQQAIAVLKGTTFGYRIRPHSPRWNQAMMLLEQIGAISNPDPPPPPTQRYAPRAYNTAPNGSDARFCMSSAYGVQRTASGYVDALGVLYDEGGRDLGGRTKLLVEDLKPANEMDDRDVCDPYIGPTGRRIGGADGYPPASFAR